MGFFTSIIFFLKCTIQPNFKLILIKPIKYKGGENIRKQMITSKTKFFIPLLLISLTLLFCVSTVSAADSIYVNTTGNDDTGTGSADNPYLTIQKGMDNVNENGTINIANGQYSGINNTNIAINKNMNIIGESQTGTIINGTGTNWIFNITSGVNVTICNLTLTNGNNTNGGTIQNNGNLTVNNCIFTSNTAGWDGTNTNYGGAINNQGTLTVNDSIFNNNSARVGGAIYNSPDSTLNVNNSIFNSNAGKLGGAIYNHGSSIVKGSTFTGNTAQRGGAIFNLNYNLLLNVDNCIFTDNNATYNFGGAIYNNDGNVTVAGSIFTNNSAPNRGGAVYNEGLLNVIGCTFTGNNVIFGGAIYNWGTLIVDNCNFTDNSATNGGAIYNQGSLTINNCTFTNNKATDSGGVIYNYGSSCYLNFNRIVGNNATSGSAIYSTKGSMNAENNWWGSNTNPASISNLIVVEEGSVDADPWVILTIHATQGTINNTGTSNITADFNHINGSGDLIGGHIPDGPITLDIPWGSFTKSGITHSITLNTINGLVTAAFYANEGAVNPLFNPVKVTATADNYTTNNTESAYITINKTSNLYIKITSDKNNPAVGKTFTLTYKLGNKGPDDATNVTITIPLPEGFVISEIKGDRIWTINGNTITWTLTNVPVGDPYLYISGKVLKPGSYVFGSFISSEDYNIDSEGVTPITINAVSQVKAASKTIPMQETGLPIAGLVLAVLAVFSGLVTSKKF